MRLILFILVLACATIFGVMISQDPGYTLFSYGDWTLEMPLWLTIIFFIIVLFLGFLILLALYMLLSSSSRIRLWWRHRKENRARKQLSKGLLALAQGQYKRAESFLSTSAKYSDVPLIHYLSAAKAAEENHAPERRDKYLALAHDISGDAITAVRLTEAELQYSHGNFDQSIATLQHLHFEQPKHPHILKLLGMTYLAMSDWHSLYSLLPELKKAGIYSPEKMQALELDVHQALLPEFADKDPKMLRQFWRATPKTIQQDPTIIVLYVNCLLAQHNENEAEELLKQTLKQQWDPKLIEMYGKLKSAYPEKQLNFAESFVPAHENDPYLLLVLGKLCANQKLWGKARDYLEASLSLKPLPETYAAVGQVMEAMGNIEKAHEYYKKGCLEKTQHH